MSQPLDALEAALDRFDAELTRITQIRIADGTLHTIPTVTAWQFAQELRALLVSERQQHQQEIQELKMRLAALDPITAVGGIQVPNPASSD